MPAPLVGDGLQWVLFSLANERLQAVFNKVSSLRKPVVNPVVSCMHTCMQHVFQLELEEYKKEGVDTAVITYTDNQDMLVLLFKRPSPGRSMPNV